MVAALVAGTLADADLITILLGPRLYLIGRQTITHSLPGTLCLVLLGLVVGTVLRRDSFTAADKAHSIASTARSGGSGSLLAACLLTACAHVAMDALSSNGVELLWPFRSTRFTVDWLPSVDAWILALLLCGLLLPELFRMVSSEIGAKDKSPRGRTGALVGLALLILYCGGRAALHANAAAQLEAHTYVSEASRKSAALADTISLTNWHGVVETASAVCAVDVPALESTRFDPERAACAHKPEPSPDLQAAQRTEAVRRLVEAARFPRASVAPTAEGSEVVVRDEADAALGGSRYAVAARVQLDRSGAVTNQSLVWARTLRIR